MYSERDLVLACSSSSPEIVPNDRMAIQHPFSPDYYTNNQECQWLVVAPSNKRIEFLLAEINLAKGDYLVIKDGVNESSLMLRNISSEGSTSGKSWESSGSVLWVKFKTDHQNVGKGFKILLIFQDKSMGKPAVCHKL